MHQVLEEVGWSYHQIKLKTSNRKGWEAKENGHKEIKKCLIEINEPCIIFSHYNKKGSFLFLKIRENII